MNAIVLTHYGASPAWQEVPTPQPATGEVLVAVRAAAVNHVDYEKASGAMKQVFPLLFPWTPGYDFAGVITAVGAGVEGFATGDEVYGTSTRDGAYADFIRIPSGQIALKPRSLSFVEAASVPVSAETAWQVLFEHAKISAGQTVLIHGGAGAVGTYAVQFAHQAGARVLVTASAGANEALTNLGADAVIDYRTVPFETVSKSVDAVIDLVGGDTQQRSYPLVNEGGYLVSINQPVSAERAAQYRIHAIFAELEPTSAGLTQIARRIDDGQLAISLGNVYPVQQVATAWQELQGHPVAGQVRKPGRIVLQLQ